MRSKPVYIAECYFDTLIIKTISEIDGFRWRQNKEIWHAKGTQLFNQMESRNRHGEGLTVGFFDKNKKGMHDNNYLKKFNSKKQNNGVQWLTFEEQHILYLEQGAERWFLDAATSVSQRIPDIPTFEEFKKETKKSEINQNTKKFIKAVIKENPPQIQTLREYITAIFGEQIHSLSTE